MNNPDQLSNLIERRLSGLTAVGREEARRAVLWYLVSGLPFVAAVLLAMFFMDSTTNPLVGMVIAASAIGLSIILWNLGAAHQLRARRAEIERDRLESIQMILATIPLDELTPRQLVELLAGSALQWSSAQISAFDTPGHEARYALETIDASSDGKDA